MTTNFSISRRLTNPMMGVNVYRVCGIARAKNQEPRVKMTDNRKMKKSQDKIFILLS